MDPGDASSPSHSTLSATLHTPLLNLVSGVQMRKFPPEASGNSTGGLHATAALQNSPTNFSVLGSTRADGLPSDSCQHIFGSPDSSVPRAVSPGERPPCVWLAHTARARTVHPWSCASRNLQVARAMPLSARPPCAWLTHTARARTVHSRTRDMFFHQDDLTRPTSRCSPNSSVPQGCLAE